MRPLGEIPAMGRHDAPFFPSVLSPAAFTPFQRDSSGVMVSEHKTVDGSNRSFGLAGRHQRRRKRLGTPRPFAVDACNQARVGLRERMPGTPMKLSGVLSLEA